MARRSNEERAAEYEKRARCLKALAATMRAATALRAGDAETADEQLTEAHGMLRPPRE